MKKIEDYINKKVVIHCKTQDEAKKINELIVLNGGRDLNDMFNTYKENTCYLLDLPLNTYSNLNYFKKNNYTIYPALDFLEEIIPEYVEYTDLIEDRFYVALIERNPEWNSIFKSKGKLELSYRLYLDNSKFKNYTGTWNVNNVIFRKATEDEIKWIKACIDANKLISKEEALKVKEKPEFIVGKWYKYNCGNVYYLKCNKFNNNKPNKIYYSEYISCKNSNHTKQIGEFENEYVTHEEVSLEEIQKYLPDGHPDKIVKSKPQSTPINTYDLYVGMDLPENIINKWPAQGNNYYEESHGWKKETRLFIGNRKISSFKELNGIIGFEVSGTLNLFLKAEGFKEFMDNFNKSKVEEEWIPKVGDWIVVIHQPNGSENSKIYNNKCLKITEIHVSNSYVCTKETPHGLWYKYINYKQEFRKALPHEIPVDEYDISSNSELPYQLNQVFETENNSNQPIYLEYQELKPMNYKQGQIFQPILKEKTNLQIIKIN